MRTMCCTCAAVQGYAGVVYSSPGYEAPSLGQRRVFVLLRERFCLTPFYLLPLTPTLTLLLYTLAA